MERPKTNWKEYLSLNKGFKGAVKSSFKNYKERYLKNDKDYPREEDFSTKSLVSGKIYTFTYTSEGGPGPSNPYTDKRPVILSLGKVNVDDLTYEGGINFNLVPHEIRLGMLDRVYLSFKDNIERMEKKISEEKNIPKALPINYDLSKKLFSGMGFETAYYVYDRKKMKDVRIFDYDDWISVVALNTKAVVGKPLNQIWEEYISKMNKKINRLEEIKKSLK